MFPFLLFILNSENDLSICRTFFFFAGNRLLNAERRYQSSYVGNLARRVRDTEEASELAHLKELYHRNDPEAVIRLFESQPSLHANPSALSEYVKALVRVDRLDDSELIKTLHRGNCGNRVLLFIMTFADIF